MGKKIPVFNTQKIIFSYEYSGEKLNFRYISLKDTEYIQKIIKETPKSFSTKVLINQIENKNEFNQNELKKFIILNLEKIIKEYVGKNNFLNKYYKKSKKSSLPEKFRDSFKIYFNERAVSMKAFSDSVTNQINFMIKPFLSKFNTLNQINKIYSSILEPFRRNFESLNKLISQIKIDDKKCISKLKKSSWIITLEMPITIINLICDAKNAKEMNTIFEAYYFANDFEELDKCLIRWNKNHIYKKRMKIFKDSFGIIKSLDKNKKINVRNIIIPALINQIEGIKIDYLNSKGYSSTRRVSFFRDSNGDEKHFKDIFEIMIQNESDEFMKWGFSFFKDILFQNENDHTKITRFSRHKISHGKIVKYGTKENLIRNILMLDFLSQMTQ